MSRRASFAVLGAAAAVVVGCALFVLVGITAGVWQPRGAPPPARATQQPGPISIGGRSYDQFLDDVRAGRVVHASQEGDLVQVDTVEGAYTVDAPPGADVFSDIHAAANDGGVAVPPFDMTGSAPVAIGYDEFLDEVREGQIADVTQQGSQLNASGDTRQFLVTVPSADTDVLHDIETAAAAGGVSPPFYSKAPTGP
jgi:hypothetical protein